MIYNKFYSTRYHLYLFNLLLFSNKIDHSAASIASDYLYR